MTMNKKVLHSDGTLEPFKPRFIKEQLLRETDVSEEQAEKIKVRVNEKIKKMEIDEISTAIIRAEVSAQLTNRGLFGAEEDSRKLGMSVKEFEDLTNNGCRDNANIDYSPEMVAKYSYDSIAKEYALLKMPKECADAHIEGYVHCLGGNNNLIVKIGNDILLENIKNIVRNIQLYPSMKMFVPSINPKTLDIEWKKIVNAQKTGYKECYEVEFRKGYKIEVTNDHKFLKYNSRYNKFADNYNICIKDIKNFNTIRIGSLNYIPYQCTDNYYESALFGFFLGDGRLDGKKIVFHLKKEGKIKYLINLLNVLDISYENHFYKDTVLISFNNTFYKGDDEKKNIYVEFPINYTGLLEGLINSDGYVTLHGKYKSIYLEYDSTNKNITDLFFIGCLIHNIRPSYQKIHQSLRNDNWQDLYRCIVQNKYVDDLITNINLREEHKERINGYNPSKTDVHETTGLTIKNVKSLGKQNVYNITVEDNHNFMAGTQGFILVQNCHDLEYAVNRPNCFNADLRFYAKNGLKIDGKGLMGSVAKPAKTLEVLLNHLLQAWMAGATVFSGGQGYVNFNTLLAPFAKGRTYEEIKQAIQGFIFNCNMSLICRGGQVLFSSIGVDLSVPDVLKEEPAIGPGGVANGVYADYQEEADLIFRAICEVSNEKDGNGAYHRFPNILFNIRDGDLVEYSGTCKLLHETGANNPTIYYVNCTDLERTVMGCRTALPMNYTGDYEKDCCNTGNFMYSTLNLPLIALQAKENIKENGKSLRQEFYDLLGYMCDVIYDTLIWRRQQIEDVIYKKHMSDFLLQKDKETNKELYNFDTTTMTLGFCGLYECLQILDMDEGVGILNFLNSKKELYHEKDGLRWSVIGSPAESASHRFAEIIKEKYPDAPVQGTKDHYYLTNSSHIPVSNETTIVDHIRNAGVYHPLTLGGNILHIWLGEVWSDPEALWKLNQKIIKEGAIFWAYSKVFTYCNECGFTINDLIEECPICKSKDLITYDRITGYYLPTRGFNNGKQQEFKERYRHKINI